MPTRILREGINDSKAVNSLSDSAEIFYRRLLSVVDDFGRFEADAEILRGEMFKRKLDSWSIERIDAALVECSETRTQDGLPLVLVYEIGNRKYLEIQNFGQRVRSKSKYPEPRARQAVAAMRGEVPPPAAECGGLQQPAADRGDCPPTRARGRTESESEAETYSEAETNAKSEKAPIPFPPTRPSWELDETYHPFVAVWREIALVTGKPLIEEDFVDAHFRWGKLSFDYKLLAIKTSQDHLDLAVWTGASDPQYIPLPARYLEKEFKRPVVGPRPRDSPNASGKPPSTDAVKALAIKNFERTGRIL